jgi:hypothetical protein
MAGSVESDARSFVALLGPSAGVKSVRTEHLDHLFIIGEIIQAESLRRISHISTAGTCITWSLREAFGAVSVFRGFLTEGQGEHLFCQPSAVSVAEE